MWLQTGNETTWSGLAMYKQRPDCQSKITWNQVCVLARHTVVNFDGFSSPKLRLTMDIMHACCYEKDLQFSWEICAAKVHTSGENYSNWLVLFYGFQGGNKNFAEIRAASVSDVSLLCCLISCGVGVLLKHLFLYEKFDELHVSSVTLQYRSQYTAIVEVMFKSV